MAFDSEYLYLDGWQELGRHKANLLRESQVKRPGVEGGHTHTHTYACVGILIRFFEDLGDVESNQYGYLGVNRQGLEIRLR